jgi:hypothetical protein
VFKSELLNKIFHWVLHDIKDIQIYTTDAFT